MTKRVKQFKGVSGEWLDDYGRMPPMIGDERRIVFRSDDPAMSYDAIEFCDDPGNIGWHIVSYDADGTSFDSVGPYDTIEEAEQVYNDTRT